MAKIPAQTNPEKKTRASGRQSVDRGLEILRLLAHNGPITASAIGKTLGVQQSSASRLLQSLIKAGFVRKPTFHSFALDYGILYFAGLAMEQFPLVPAATRVCNDLHVATGYGSTVAIMPDERLLYLARVHEQPPALVGAGKSSAVYSTSHASTNSPRPAFAYWTIPPGPFTPLLSAWLSATIWARHE